MPLHGTPVNRASALRTQNTSATHLCAHFVFHGSANGMHSARLEGLTGRTAVDVAHGIINKGFISKDVSVAPVVRFAGGIARLPDNSPVCSSPPTCFRWRHRLASTPQSTRAAL